MTTTPVQRAARPPRAWEMQTAAVMVAVAAVTLPAMLHLAGQIAVWAYLRSEGASGLSPLVRSLVDNAVGLDALAFFLAFVYVLGFYWWRWKTREMLRIVGDTAGNATVHWAVVAWGALLFGSFTLRVYAPDPAGGLEYAYQFWAASAALRLLGLCLLLIGVWQIREQVRRRVAAAGIALRVDELGGRPSSTPARPAPVLTPLAPARRDDLPTAGDAFWDRASRLATDAASDIAVLETVGGLARRWSLIPPTGDIAAVRSAIPAGATVAVFPEPPAATPVEAWTPPPADEYYGFLEDAETGALWFQSVTPKRVPAFLARARTARRWALYPTDSPTTRTAVQ